MSMFAKNLCRALSQNSIKQVDFARVIGVPPTTVSGWIRGAHEPSIDMLLTVCSYLNIPVGEMVGDKNSYVNSRADVDKLRCKVAELTECLEKQVIRCKEVATERDQYIGRVSALEAELDSVNRYADRYRLVVETLKADGAKEISIKF